MAFCLWSPESTVMVTGMQSEQGTNGSATTKKKRGRPRKHRVDQPQLWTMKRNIVWWWQSLAVLCLIAVGAHCWHAWWWQSQCDAWLLWVLTVDVCDAWLLLLLTVDSHLYVSLEMDNAAVWDVVKWWTVNEPLVLTAQKKLPIMLILVFGLVCFSQTVEIFFFF